MGMVSLSFAFASSALFGQSTRHPSVPLFARTLLSAPTTTAAGDKLVKAQRTMEQVHKQSAR